MQWHQTSTIYCAHFPLLLEHASQAESFVYTAPRASCFHSRFALEQAVQWLYANDAYLQLPYDKNLGALIHEQTFKDNLKPGLFPKVSVIHKIGNTAVHDAAPINSKDALHVVKELFHFLYWLSRFYSPNPKNHPNVTFNSDLIPKAKTGEKDLSLSQLQKLDKKPLLADQMRQIEEEREKKTSTEIAALKAQIATLKEQSSSVPDSHNYNEEETRRYLIDVLLLEAGWDVHQPEWTEYEVTGMPNKTRKGYVDYVLWGADGKNSYAQSLLDDFSDSNKQPNIAVSVDMLDTGVDVPEVVNLVFFKPVYSQVKFSQMIGRGTRLCKDLFGIGASKTEFFVFDLCSNFEYFDQQLPEKEVKPTQSISGQLFKARVKLSNALSESGGQYKALRSNLLDNLHQQVESMQHDNFVIRPHLQQVNEFSQRARWDKVSNTDIEAINQLAELPNGLPVDNPLSKQFDLLILKLQLAVLSPQEGNNFVRLRDQVRDSMQRLELSSHCSNGKSIVTLNRGITNRNLVD